MKSVKTLPATMLATERLDVRLGRAQAARAAAPPRRWSAPCGCVAASTRPSIPERPRWSPARSRIASTVPVSAEASRQRATGPAEALLGRVPEGDEALPGRRPARRATSSTSRCRAGEICVFVGPSGCGKTTAMRMVNRMVEITEGDILVGGHLGARALALRAAARDRLRDPADRALPPPHDRREHRDRPAAARLGPRASRGSGRRAAWS